MSTSLKVHILSRGALAALLLCAAISSAQAQSEAKGSSIAHAPAKKQIVVGVPNFGEVTPTLYRGAQPSAIGFRNLAEMGVAVVVDFRGDDLVAEKREVAATGMKLIPLGWDCRYPSDNITVHFLQILNENRGKKIFVHCYSGVDRTGAMIAAYRMADQGWTAQQAMNEMRVFGRNFIHRLICHALTAYVYNFPKDMQENPQLRALQAGAHPHSAN
jgi:protein-tyrosine phosphatase